MSAKINAVHMLPNYLAQVKNQSEWNPINGRGWVKSQTWRGIDWKHDLVIVEPEKRTFDGRCILEVTGDNVADEDLVWAKQLADMSGYPVAILMQVPNQPIFDLEEDDLIALTYEKFLDGGDEDWPLLLPMTASVFAVMDQLEKQSGFSQFVVTGASKRGWTTWLAGVQNDPRIVGIAPRVFDNLNMPAQMRHQIEVWGEFSPMIDSYTRLNLHERLETELGQMLLQTVDPYCSLKNYKTRTLIVTGANDPYWATDAMRLYSKDVLNGTYWSLTLPNNAHRLNLDWLPTMSVFSHKCFTESGPFHPEGDLCLIQWEARSVDQHFADAEWRIAKLDLAKGVSPKEEWQPEPLEDDPAFQFRAILPEVHYYDSELVLEYKLTAPIFVSDCKFKTKFNSDWSKCVHALSKLFARSSPDAGRDRTL